MAYDEGLAQVFRDDLAKKRSITEKKMFGGLCFMHRGHMLCGVHRSRDKTSDMAMFRVGPEQYQKALEMEGVNALTFTNRPMKGLVECHGDIFGDDKRRSEILEMALNFTTSLPPK